MKREERKFDEAIVNLWLDSLLSPTLIQMHTKYMTHTENHFHKNSFAAL